jgi:hypothetical protein
MTRAIPSRATRASRARGILRALGFVAVFWFFGCSGVQLDPRAQRAADVFECYVAAVEPYLGGVCDVAELVRDAVEGRASVPQALALLGASVDDMRAIDAAMTACRGAPETPPVNPRTLAHRTEPGDVYFSRHSNMDPSF